MHILFPPSLRPVLPSQSSAVQFQCDSSPFPSLPLLPASKRSIPLAPLISARPVAAHAFPGQQRLSNALLIYAHAAHSIASPSPSISNHSHASAAPFQPVPGRLAACVSVPARFFAQPLSAVSLLCRVMPKRFMASLCHCHLTQSTAFSLRRKSMPLLPFAFCA